MSALNLQQFVSQRPRFTVLLSLIVPAVLLFLLMKAAGAGQVPEAPGAALDQPVDVIKVERQKSYSRLMKVVGRAEANKRANLGFERGGTLLQSFVDEGDGVTKGQLLAELDTQRLAAQMQEIEAGIARAKADARLAKLSENRIALLVKQNLESSQRLDETREATEAAQALVREMQARKESVQVEFAKSKILSPFDGTILSRPVDPGSVVAQGMTVLSIQQEAGTEVRLAMAANKAFALIKGHEYELYRGKQVFSARLKSIANARTINTRTVDAILEINDGSDNATSVLPGDLLTLMLPMETEIAGYWVPNSALTNGIRGMWNLFTVANGDGKETLVTKSVNVLYSDSTKAFVTGALHSQDYVVLHGGHRLVPNQKVSTTTVPFPQSEKTLELVSNH